MKQSLGNPVNYSILSRPDERGITLIMVMIILIVVSLLGAGGAQIALMSERSARNDRDQQVAWQAAEEGLVDAEIDMWNTASTRRSIFDGQGLVDFPATGCGTSGNSKGLCASVVTGKPAWLTQDLTDTSAGAGTTAVGAFTGRIFEAGGPGVTPAKVPRYIIEPVIAQIGSKSGPPEIWYRVTAMGFGPRADIQSVVQMLYRN